MEVAASIDDVALRETGRAGVAAGDLDEQCLGALTLHLLFQAIECPRSLGVVDIWPLVARLWHDDKCFRYVRWTDRRRQGQVHSRCRHDG